MRELRVKKTTAMRESRRFFDSAVGFLTRTTCKKRAIKSDTSGYCLEPGTHLDSNTGGSSNREQCHAMAAEQCHALQPWLQQLVVGTAAR